MLAALDAGEPVYGVKTGMGALSELGSARPHAPGTPRRS